MSHTTYQFDILADDIVAEHALDIFSNFFINPLFTKSGTGREVHAVDSENSKNLVNDGRRRWQILKDLGDATHHFSKFSTGNKFTLPAASEDATAAGAAAESKDVNVHPLTTVLKEIDSNYNEEDMSEFVRAALLAFHRYHYRPKNMAVVVVGPQELDTLESWAVPRFSNIPDDFLEELEDTMVANGDSENHSEEYATKWFRLEKLATKLIEEAAKEAPPVSVQDAKTVNYNPAFRPELQGGKWPVLVTTKPLQSMRKLVLFFPMHPTYDNPDRSPTRILSHLFGHEGKGSPFATLQDSGWISSLSAGTRVGGPDQNLFQIDVSLTEEGEVHWKEVVNVIFAYGKMLCDAVEVSLKNNETCNATAAAAEEDVLRRVWDEVGRIDRMHFHQTSPGAVYR
jgi:insulysin